MNYDLFSVSWSGMFVKCGGEPVEGEIKVYDENGTLTATGVGKIEYGRKTMRCEFSLPLILKSGKYNTIEIKADACNPSVSFEFYPYEHAIKKATCNNARILPSMELTMCDDITICSAEIEPLQFIEISI